MHRLAEAALASSLEEDTDVVTSLAGDVRVACHGQGPVSGLDGDLRRIVVHAQDLCTTLSLQSCLVP